MDSRDDAELQGETWPRDASEAAGYEYRRGASVMTGKDIRVGIEQVETRIRQLEALNARLAAEVDRQTAVVDAARNWRHLEARANHLAITNALYDAVDAYERGL